MADVGDDHSSSRGGGGDDGGSGGDNQNKSLRPAMKVTGGVTKNKIRYGGEAQSGSNNGTILLKIAGPDGMVVHMKAKRNVPMQRVFVAYCEEKNLEYAAMKFFRRQQRVLVRATPDELHLKDGCQIDALVSVDGGGGCDRSSNRTAH